MNYQLTLPFTQEPKKNGFQYLREGIEAEGHTLVYKMHKYFARRPQNVFRHLIQHYSKPGDVLLDCFCGGGVSVFEGISLARRVIGVDLNPLATFITDCQTTAVSIDEYTKVMRDIYDRVRVFSEGYFVTKCRESGKDVAVRWYELAYIVKCPQCSQRTLLSNSQKAPEVTNGRYVCSHCRNSFEAVRADRLGYELVSVTYKCPVAKTRKTVGPDKRDIEIFTKIERQFDSIIAKHKLEYPTDEIPEEWDRQKEDCLHRKGVRRFSDFFTKRNLLVNAYYQSVVESYRKQVSPDLFKMLMFTFSATIRHTGNLTISTAAWMDGRPVAWAKHAYWLPNQFVEVNPLEYIQKRTKAVVSGLRFQQDTLQPPKRVNSYTDLLQNGTHIIWTQSSDKLDIPDDSLDLIVTDPPYGSNVQYGELSSFWLVWLKKYLGLSQSKVMDFDNEILVYRKKKSTENNKDYTFYYHALRRTFREGFRALKPGKPLVFTFNNKDMRAWYAVIKAAIDAGFSLDERGIIYQGPIENYKNTAHTRFAGSLHGDFIYTFLKPVKPKAFDENGRLESTNIEQIIIDAARQVLRAKSDASVSEIYIGVFAKLIPALLRKAHSAEEFSVIAEQLQGEQIEDVLLRHLKAEKRSGRGVQIE